jgi:hypothetical protein
MRQRSALLTSLLLVLAACSSGTPAGPPSTPGGSSAVTASPAPTPTDQATSTVRIWVARATPDGVWVEPWASTGARTMAPARQAFQHLISVPPDDPALQTLAPEGTKLHGVDIDRDTGVLTVDVSADIDAPGTGHGSAQETAFAQQLAHTATQFAGVRSVRLLVDGEPIDELWGHLDWSQPIEPDPFALTPITIEEPRWGFRREGTGPLTASGQANTFEATLGVRLIDPDGEVFEEEWITATSGSGTRGTWTHTFGALGKRGTWVLEAEEPDPSGGAEGRKPLIVRREFRIT